MLEIKNVAVGYRKKTVLENVSFTAYEGECIGLLGINGSGKSTLLQAVSACNRLKAGDIIFNGSSIITDTNAYRKNIGFIPQENALIEELSAMDNLKLWSPLSTSEIKKRLETEPLSYLGVHSILSIPIKKMSGGMKKRLQIATCLINNPKLLLLDEPFASLDLIAKQDIMNYLKLFMSNGGTVIIASHEENLFPLCTKIFLLNNGTLTYFDPSTPGSVLIEKLRETIGE